MRKYDKLIIVCLLALALLYIGGKVHSQDQRLTAAPPVKPAEALSASLEQERLAALPELKAKLEQLQQRERGDLVFIINEALFNKVLSELTEMKFNAGGLFNVAIAEPHVILKNGLMIARMNAQLIPTNSLFNITSNLAVTARLIVEQDESEALVAKMQVIELTPISASNPDQKDSQSAPTISPQQLSSLLPPLKLPLELDFDHTFRPEGIKQSKPIAYEINAQPRRIQGHFEIIELLPLSGRLVALARVRNLAIK
jgi:hypothetical protein